MKQFVKCFLSIFLLFMLIIPVLGEELPEPEEQADTACTALGIFANMGSSIQFIDPSTNMVSPQYLKGQLGTYGNLLDVAITPDGNTALLSNFGSAKIYFLDISGGFNVEPTILGWAKVPFFAEDISITPNGQYALVTDGGLSELVAVVDIPNMRFVMVRKLPFGRDAQAVTVAPDGETVIVVDYLGGKAHTLLLDENGWLTYGMKVNLGNTWPVNLAISPDGKTVIIPSSYRYYIAICRLERPGVLTFIQYLHLPTIGSQAVVFSQDGTKAYVSSNNTSRTPYQVHILDVNGPGNVSYSGTSIETPTYVGDGQFFGIESMAIDPSGKYLYLTNPTSFGFQTVVSVIDLATNTYLDILQAEGIPVGIAFTCQQSGTVVDENPNDQ